METRFRNQSVPIFPTLICFQGQKYHACLYLLTHNLSEKFSALLKICTGLPFHQKQPDQNNLFQIHTIRLPNQPVLKYRPHS